MMANSAVWIKYIDNSICYNLAQTLLNIFYVRLTK
jgi:hypothetical protein